MNMEYAVFKSGGKQYRVKPGDVLDVEKLTVEVDSIAEFGEVLAISDNGEVTFGSPYVPGAKVLAQVQSHYKDRKIIVFKYKAKTRYRRKRSHRQTYTLLTLRSAIEKCPICQAESHRASISVFGALFYS